MKNIIKKITAIAMCGVLTIGSVLMTGAVSEDENQIGRASCRERV